MKRVAFSSHVALIEGKEYDGLGNVIIETLSGICKEFIFVRHSMDGLLPSEVRYFKKDQIVKKKSLRVVRKPSLLRYCSEFISTIFYFTLKERVDVYVGVDPLNALAAVFLKKMGRIKMAIFFTPDYSPTRFSNTALNKLYHAIDRYCVENADEVWSVSTKIIAIRREMGLEDEKNILIPNVPPADYNSFRKNKHDRYMLTTNGIVGVQLDFDGVFQAIANLKEDLPKLAFTIVGNGPEERRLRRLAEKLKIRDRIHFVGRQTLAGSLEYTSKSGIGLALYTGEWGFNQFGDSTKAREFFNFGLPVISTDTHGTVHEIIESNAGIIVEKDHTAYEKAIKDVITNYEQFSEAAEKLGEKYEGIHKKEFLRILK